MCPANELFAAVGVDASGQSALGSTERRRVEQSAPGWLAEHAWKTPAVQVMIARGGLDTHTETRPRSLPRR